MGTAFVVSMLRAIWSDDLGVLNLNHDIGFALRLYAGDFVAETKLVPMTGGIDSVLFSKRKPNVPRD